MYLYCPRKDLSLFMIKRHRTLVFNRERKKILTRKLVAIIKALTTATTIMPIMMYQQ